MQSGDTYVITGGTGFLGRYLIERLYPFYNLRVVARNENELVKLKKNYPLINIFAGDLCHKSFVQSVLENTNGIFHLAAFKHVRLAEEQPSECIQTNILGTLTLLQCSEDILSLRFFLGVSTDKASQVTGVYGATKLLMERLFFEYSKKNSKIKYRTVRLGNIFYSSGSVLCKWKELLSEGKDVMITDENITRFYQSPTAAIDCILESLEQINDEPYIPDVKSVVLKDLLDVMIQKYVPTGKHISIKKIGIQPGENFHETLVHNGKSSNEVSKYTKDELYTLI
jgi:UDP-N-acetylglucosamine 4,6-dehydratase